MDDNEMKQAEEVLTDIGKGIAKAGEVAFKHGFIVGAAAIITGIGIGHLMIYLPKAIKNRKKNETK